MKTTYVYTCAVITIQWFLFSILHVFLSFYSVICGGLNAGQMLCDQHKLN